MSQISGIQSNLNNINDPVPELGVGTTHAEELRSLLNHINDWGLDTFRVEDLSGQRPLTAITYRIFQERSLLRAYAIEPRTLISYLLTLEDHYQTVPYHNKAHGADVCQSMHVLLNASALDVKIDAQNFRVSFDKRTNLFLLSTGCLHRIRNYVSYICFSYS